jgi:hypothetical protein
MAIEDSNCSLLGCDAVVMCFRGPCCLHLQGEEGGSMVLWNAGILSHHYTVSHSRRLCLDISDMSLLMIYEV